MTTLEDIARFVEVAQARGWKGSRRDIERPLVLPDAIARRFGGLQDDARKIARGPSDVQ